VEAGCFRSRSSRRVRAFYRAAVLIAGHERCRRAGTDTDDDQPRRRCCRGRAIHAVSRTCSDEPIGPRPIEDPIATITGTPRIGIVEGEIQPFTISAGGPELEAKGVDEPLRTVLTREHQAIVEAFLIKFHGGENAENRNYPIDEPVGTLDTSNRFGLVEASRLSSRISVPETRRNIAQNPWTIPSTRSWLREIITVSLKPTHFCSASNPGRSAVG
jgi:hypothetical protein